MPRKERPAALADTIFRPKLEPQIAQPQQDAIPEESFQNIPVHNTFIQFGSPEDLENGKQTIATAPAWIGPSFQSMVQSAMQSAIQVPLQGGMGAPPETVPTTEEDDEEKFMVSPKKVPVMRYSMSASSARAAGLPAGSNVVTSYDPGGCRLGDIMGSQAGDSKQGDDDDVDESGEEEDDSGDDDVMMSARQAPRGPLAPPGDAPSIGSVKHNEGLCKRCCFFPKGRCLNGKDCEFCHYEHDKRKRKKKKKGSKTKAQESDSDSDGDEPNDEPLPAESPNHEATAVPAQSPEPQLLTPTQVPPPFLLPPEPTSQTVPAVPVATMAAGDATRQGLSAPTAQSLTGGDATRQGSSWTATGTLAEKQPPFEAFGPGLRSGPAAGAPLTAPPPLPPRLPGAAAAAPPVHYAAQANTTPSYDSYFASVGGTVYDGGYAVDGGVQQLDAHSASLASLQNAMLDASYGRPMYGADPRLSGYAPPYGAAQTALPSGALPYAGTPAMPTGGVPPPR